ncbi:MAG TPA: hypothetical protein VNK49_02215, partial [Anaerolineales bacterium]|nr:hypothetical protein [Anaerolineales bacterium]
DNFTLTPNGLEVKLSDGTIVEAAGVAVQPDGTLTITIDGQEKSVTEIEVADNQIFLKAADGKTYTFSQEGQLIPTYPISEAREFVPANDIEFVENLPDYNLKLAPDADRDAIYWDIIVSHLGDVISKSKGMEANRAIYEEIIKDHPEWEGIGHSWDYKVRVEFMKEFLKRTGGWMIVTDMNFNKYEANLNEKIKLEVVQVTELPKGFLPELPLNDSDSVGKGAGTGMYVNDKGQIVYSVAMVGDTLRYTLNEDERSIFNTTNWTDGEVISELFRNLIASTATHSRTDYKVVPATNHKLYVKGSDPDSQGYFLDVTWTFIK